MSQKRPQTTVILAMTADGKIADFQRNPSRFGSQADKAHLEEQLSLMDGVLFGAETLRAYGTTLSITNSLLLENRRQKYKPLQPVQLVVSGSGKIDPNIRFFSQSIPRWLITTIEGANTWSKKCHQGFEKLVISNVDQGRKIDLQDIFERLYQLELSKLAILGGGNLIASLLEANLIDNLWLTICPLLFGGVTSPTPVEGVGFLSHQAKPLQLLTVKQIEQEIFLHYRL
ncbi:putative riboflavin-specific deaminase [cyanobacterium endosymbiont of Rhopalodia gibberula]|uniref:RibD family protein n=1 Tax=cyanobacterium endosymbiont of Rhopalodia gibberula TaxID=1763363 RepID=UPI000DC713BF|nr:RibD family protein [cyanobacterium endosymbiont of Rhopalodia gibberula]BBA79378.1 putative riboflavin-specific deaminase [cyanobacterium endosymbiont of Rhopalodia gibberula]